MRKTAAILLTCVMAVSFAACGNGQAGTDKGTETKSESENSKENTDKTEEAGGDKASLDYEELIIGVDDTFAPMGFLDEKNELTGFDIDMAQAVSKKLGIPVKFQTVEWTMKEQELNQGNIDLIWNGYSITDERKEQVLFTNPYLDNKQVVVTMADSGINSLSDLEGKVVAAQEDSSAVEAIDANPELANSFGDRPEFATNDMAIMDMEAGRSDAVVADSVLLNYVISHKDDPSQYKILEEDLGTEEFAVGVRKEDTALADAINQAFEELKEEGTAKEISEKWFGEDIVK